MKSEHEFSFSLVEVDENTTQVLFLPKHTSVIHDIFESYDFNITDHSERCFYVDECLDDVFEELDSYEVDEGLVALTEQDEGFYLSPLDDIYEILMVSVVNDDLLLEGPARRKLVIRKGKRKVIFKCGPGQMKVGKSCRRRSTTQLNKMKRRAKITARKSRKKRRSTARKRKLSMRKRSFMIHTTKKKSMTPRPPSKPKHYKPKR